MKGKALTRLAIALTHVTALTSTILIPVKMALAADLDTIRDRGHFLVAVKDNLRPLGFRDADGALVGLEIDIARRLADEVLGDPSAVVLQPVSNTDRITTLTAGEVDLVIARLTLTEARARLVDFSLVYYLDGTALVTRNPALQSARQLDGARVAVLEGSSTIAVVRSRLPNAQLIGVQSYQDAKRLLDQGGADAFAADASVLTGWVQAFPNYQLLPQIWSGEALAIAMPRGTEYAELRRAVNGAIERWRESGWLDERIQHWGLPQQVTFQ